MYELMQICQWPHLTNSTPPLVLQAFSRYMELRHAGQHGQAMALVGGSLALTEESLHSLTLAQLR